MTLGSELVMQQSGICTGPSAEEVELRTPTPPVWGSGGTLPNKSMALSGLRVAGGQYGSPWRAGSIGVGPIASQAMASITGITGVVASVTVTECYFYGRPLAALQNHSVSTQLFEKRWLMMPVAGSNCAAMSVMLMVRLFEE